MKLNRLVLSACLAGAFGTLCVVFAIVGALITLVAGLIGLAVVTRRASAGTSNISEYPWWLFCIIVFIGTTVVLSPLAELPAVIAGLWIFSPLLGTMIYVVERAMGVATR